MLKNLITFVEGLHECVSTSRASKVLCYDESGKRRGVDARRPCELEELLSSLNFKKHLLMLGDPLNSNPTQHLEGF